MRRPAPIALALSTLLLGGCLFGSPSPSPSSSAVASQLVSVQPSTSASPASATPAPTPGADAIPTFTAGTTVKTNASGLRVRKGPGLTQGVLTLLPTGSKLVVELGPVRNDSWGWYLVRDADAAEPTFEEGWVAAGFMPTPYLTPATFELPFNPIVAGFAHEGNGEFGPVPIQDANYAVRWVAVVLPGGGGCAFSADLVPGSGTAVPAIRATLGTAPAPGSLYGDFFTAHPELVGDIFLRVTSDCSWALSIVRSEPVGG
ncbi:MAG: SH3 domain-containing protein [Chloroflexi bacterium]|nr:SH3 domain-containing protein [Chloroflexota bacterium]